MKLAAVSLFLASATQASGQLVRSGAQGPRERVLSDEAKENSKDKPSLVAGNKKEDRPSFANKPDSSKSKGGGGKPSLVPWNSKSKDEPSFINEPSSGAKYVEGIILATYSSLDTLKLINDHVNSKVSYLGEGNMELKSTNKFSTPQ